MARMRRRVSSPTPGLSLSASDTVAADTPAIRAMSTIRTLKPGPAS